MHKITQMENNNNNFQQKGEVIFHFKRGTKIDNVILDKYKKGIYFKRRMQKK